MSAIASQSVNDISINGENISALLVKYNNIYRYENSVERLKSLQDKYQWKRNVILTHFQRLTSLNYSQNQFAKKIQKITHSLSKINNDYDRVIRSYESDVSRFKNLIPTHISEFDSLRAKYADLMYEYCFNHSFRFTPQLLDDMCQWKLAYNGPYLNRYQKIDKFMSELQLQQSIVPVIVKTLTGDILPIELQFNPLKTPIHLVKQLAQYDSNAFPLNNTFITRLIQNDSPVQPGELFCVISYPTSYTILDCLSTSHCITFRVKINNDLPSQWIVLHLNGEIAHCDSEIADNDEIITYCQTRLTLYL
jgi:hypothetical protein